MGREPFAERLGSGTEERLFDVRNPVVECEELEAHGLVPHQ